MAVPHEKWDERPVALVVKGQGMSPTVQEVIEHCATVFAKWQLPDDVIFVDELPLTSTGKLDKKVIRAQLESQGYALPS